MFMVVCASTEADYPNNAIGDVCKAHTVSFPSPITLLAKYLDPVCLSWGSGGWTVERGSTVGCLSLSCRRFSSGLPSLHFHVNRLQGNQGIT